MPPKDSHRVSSVRLPSSSADRTSSRDGGRNSRLSLSRTSQVHRSGRVRVDRTNEMISLANGPDPSACVAVLTHSLAAASPSSQSKDDGGSFALSSPTFEALNRVTLAYALARTGQRDVAIAQLERVARLIELDRGRTPYFAKVKKRARLVVEKRSLGTIRGINDEDDDDDREGGTQMSAS